MARARNEETPIKKKQPGDEKAPPSHELAKLKDPALRKLCGDRRIKQAGKKVERVRRLKLWNDKNFPDTVVVEDDDAYEGNLIAAVKAKLEEEDIAVPDDAGVFEEWIAEKIDIINDEEVEQNKVNYMQVRRFALNTYGRAAAVVPVAAAAPVATGRELEEDAAEMLTKGRWNKNMSGRLIAIMATADMAVGLARLAEGNANKPNQISEGGQRDEIEMPSVWRDIRTMFVDPDTVGLVEDMERIIDPYDTDFLSTEMVITESMLKGKWSALKSTLARPYVRFEWASPPFFATVTASVRRYKNWTASGNGDPESWSNFANGDPVLLYMFDVLEGCPSLLALAIRHVDCGVEEGGDDAPKRGRPGSRGNSNGNDGHDGGGKRRNLDPAGIAAAVMDGFKGMQGGKNAADPDEKAAEIALLAEQTRTEKIKGDAIQSAEIRAWRDLNNLTTEQTEMLNVKTMAAIARL